MSTEERVREEVLAALTTFTADGYAEDVGFDAGPDGVTAEVYGPGGDITERFNITFTINEMSN